MQDEQRDNPAGRHLAVDESVFRLYDRLIGDVHLPTVLRDVAAVVCQDLAAERATVFVIDDQTQELRSTALIGNVSREIRIPIAATSLAGYCAMSGRAFLVPDAYGDLGAIHKELRFDRRWDEMNDFRTRDVMCSPVLFKGGTLGVVQAVNSCGEPFREADLGALSSVSRLIGYALYHAKLYDDLATMKRLEQEKAEFMRIMVHELKSPVAAAKSMADALGQYGNLDERSSGMMGRISGRMEEMGELIGDMLVLAKAKSGGPMGQVAVVDLRAEAAGVCERFREPAEQKGLALEVELSGEAVPVRTDTMGLPLVISNLVGNAVKYTQAGRVRVTLVRGDPWAELAVTDTGIGIPAAEIPKLFGEFFRASNAKKQRIGGSGVGLALVKQMVERFGGGLSLQSEENVGSTFTVHLPVHSG